MQQSFEQEFNAMQQIASITSNLTSQERMRVAAWFLEYAAQDNDAADFVGARKDEVAATATYVTPEPEEAVQKPVASTFAEPYAAVSPKTGAQKAAVAGYWLQTQDGAESWKASEVNKLLKSIDVKVSSISIVLTNAVKAKTPLVEQLARLGEGERSRKTFRLTSAGTSYVEDRG